MKILYKLISTLFIVFSFNSSAYGVSIDTSKSEQSDFLTSDLYYMNFELTDTITGAKIFMNGDVGFKDSLPCVNKAFSIIANMPEENFFLVDNFYCSKQVTGNFICYKKHCKEFDSKKLIEDFNIMENKNEL